MTTHSITARLTRPIIARRATAEGRGSGRTVRVAAGTLMRVDRAQFDRPGNCLPALELVDGTRR